MTRVVCALVMTVFGTLFASAQAMAGVDYLGETRLGRFEDVDVIYAGQCPSPMNRPVERLKIQVLQRAADVDYVAVQYGNGVWDRLPVRERFAPGSESRWIDLVGGARCVERIKVVGDTDANRPGQALVRVWGHR